MSNVKKYRKLPVEIEAIQLTEYSLDDCYQFIDKRVGNFPETGRGIDPSDGKFKITTLEGVMIVNIGDYIIKGVNGEFYPCKPDIFAKTYEVVDNDDLFEANFRLINSTYDMGSKKYDNTEKLYVEFVHGDTISSNYFRKEDSVGEIFRLAKSFELRIKYMEENKSLESSGEFTDDQKKENLLRHNKEVIEKMQQHEIHFLKNTAEYPLTPEECLIPVEKLSNPKLDNDLNLMELYKKYINPEPDNLEIHFFHQMFDIGIYVPDFKSSDNGVTYYDATEESQKAKIRMARAWIMYNRKKPEEKSYFDTFQRNKKN